VTATTDLGLAGDRDHTLMAMVTARAWRDPEYRERLIQDPKAVLTDEGFEFPPDMEIRVLEDTPTVKHISLTPDIFDVKQAASLLPSTVAIPEDGEVRFVRSTGDIRYVVLQTPPPGVDPMVTPEIELSRHNAPVVWAAEAVVVGTTVSIVAEAVGAVVLS
jgi:Nitrile hydratase, alpha chain